MLAQPAAPATPPQHRMRAAKKRPASALSPKEAAVSEMDHVVDPLDALMFGAVRRRTCLKMQRRKMEEMEGMTWMKTGG